MFDKILKFCFFVTILFLVFLFGFLSNELKFKNIYSNLSYSIDLVENYFNFNLKKKIGDREDKKNLKNPHFKSGNNFNTSGNNFNLYNKPNKIFNDYLLIKHDHSEPVLLNSPDKLVWTWSLSKFRNSTKMIPYHMFPNGDLIIGNSEKKGIYRIDKNGQILWKRNKISHHWIDVYEDKLFIPSRNFVKLPKDIDNKLLAKSLLKECRIKNSIFDTILIINANNGKILDEIDLMKILPSNKNFIEILNENYQSDKNFCEDPLHLNDIQVIDNFDLEYLKKSLPTINKEDLILSFRNINTIIFYDYKRSSIKHIVYNLFDKQHSPRINKDGFLYVFDNNPNGKSSKIVKINLKNNTINSIFESKNFISGLRGRIQFFNDKLFIQSSGQGEVFEIICEYELFNNCEQNYVYSSNFSFFYPSDMYDSTKTFKKDAIYLADFYDKEYVKFLD